MKISKICRAGATTSFSSASSVKWQSSGHKNVGYTHHSNKKTNVIGKKKKKKREKKLFGVRKATMQNMK